MKVSGVARRSRRSARLARSAKRRCTSSIAASRPSLPSIAPPRPAWIALQRQPLAVVAGKPRPQSGAQERRFTRARGAENDEQPRRLARRKPAQRVDAAHDVGAAAEEHGSILRLKRLQAAIRRPPAERTVRVRLQLEGLGADAGLVESALERS